MLLLSKLTVEGSNPLKFIPVGCVSEGAVFVVPEAPHSGRLGPHALDFLEAAVAQRNGVSAGSSQFFSCGVQQLACVFPEGPLCFGWYGKGWSECVFFSVLLEGLHAQMCKHSAKG